MHRPILKTVVAKLHRLSPLRPTLAIILGTGFDNLLGEIEWPIRVAYRQIPGFPAVGVPGHRGELAIGRLAGEPLLLLSGRAHYYEGHRMAAVTFPVRVLAAYGIRDLLLTNAAGGISPKLRVGDLMVVEDHINLMGTNPLRGPPLSGLPRFVDLSCTYDAALRQLLHQAGRACAVSLKTGVYLAVSGPSYETPAEIKAFRRLGADAVGMSTVPEVIVARQLGIRVAARSCITNLASGFSKTPLSHREVLEKAARVQAGASQLIRRFIALRQSANKPAADSRRAPRGQKLG